MSIFGKIKDAIFGHKTASAANRPQIPAGMAGGPPVGSTATAEVSPATQPTPASAADVEQILVDMARSSGKSDLNWRSSIVDLMKLIGLDSSLENRKELATELGYTGAKDGSAEMNIWLHKQVMRQLAANGGRVPASMTD